MTTEYTGPAGLRTRGTVLIVPGRGESPAAWHAVAGPDRHGGVERLVIVPD